MISDRKRKKFNNKPVDNLSSTRRSQAMRTRPDIGLLMTSLLQDVNRVLRFWLCITGWITERFNRCLIFHNLLFFNIKYVYMCTVGLKIHGSIAKLLKIFVLSLHILITQNIYTPIGIKY